MKTDKEKPIRTDLGNMLICTAEVQPNVEIELITRNKGKEGRISVNSFLNKVYSDSNNELLK